MCLAYLLVWQSTMVCAFVMCMQGLLVRGADGKVTYRQRGEDLEVSQKLLNIQVEGCVGL
jgi:hypothetical protein